MARVESFAPTELPTHSAFAEGKIGAPGGFTRNPRGVAFRIALQATVWGGALFAIMTLIGPTKRVWGQAPSDPAQSPTSSTVDGGTAGAGELLFVLSAPKDGKDYQDLWLGILLAGTDRLRGSPDAKPIAPRRGLAAMGATGDGDIPSVTSGDIPKLAKALGAKRAVWGRLMLHPTEIVIRLRRVDTATGRNLGEDEIRASFDELPKLADHLAMAVARMVERQLPADNVIEPGTLQQFILLGHTFQSARAGRWLEAGEYVQRLLAAGFEPGERLRDIDLLGEVAEGAQAPLEWRVFAAGFAPTRLGPGGADAAYEEALKSPTLKPADKLTVRLQRGRARLAAGKAAEALADFQEAQKLDAEDARVDFELGRALVALKKTTQARAAFEAAAEKGLERPALFIALADLLERRSPTEAAEHLAQAGTYAQQEGRDLQWAQRLFERAVLLDPASGAGDELNIDLMDELVLRKWRQALEKLDARKAGPEIKRRLGIVERQAGELDLARKHLQQAIDLADDDAEAHAALGLTLLETGKDTDRDAAETHLERARALQKNHKQATLALTKLWGADKEKSDALLAVLREYVGAYPEDITTRRLLADRLGARNLRDEQIQVLTALCADEPDDGSLQAALAEALHSAGKPLDARKRFFIAKDRSPAPARATLEKRIAALFGPAALAEGPVPPPPPAAPEKPAVDPFAQQGTPTWVYQYLLIAPAIVLALVVLWLRRRTARAAAAGATSSAPGGAPGGWGPGSGTAPGLGGSNPGPAGNATLLVAGTPPPAMPASTFGQANVSGAINPFSAPTLMGVNPGIGMSMSGGAAPSAPGSATAAFAQGQLLLDAGRLAEAAQVFLSINAFEAAGEAFWRAGDGERAAWAFDAAGRPDRAQAVRMGQLRATPPSRSGAMNDPNATAMAPGASGSLRGRTTPMGGPSTPGAGKPAGAMTFSIENTLGQGAGPPPPGGGGSLRLPGAPDSGVGIPMGSLSGVSGPGAGGQGAGGQIMGGGRYRFEKELGRGAMGVVLRAWDTILERPVAFKTIAANIRQHPQALKYFLSEAKSLAQMQHPNIVSVYDIGEANGEMYIIMEFVEGRPLSDIIQEQGRLPLDQCLRIAHEVAQGLDYAHRRNVVHRDIKPSNVMLSADGQVKLMDFGLARIGMSDRTMIHGTPYYMSPEQILGVNVDHRTDLYAFGVTMFEMATGQVPFPEGDVAYHHRHTPPPAPSVALPGLPAAFDAVVLKCMEKDKEQRYATAQDLAKDLARIAGRSHG